MNFNPRTQLKQTAIAVKPPTGYFSKRSGGTQIDKDLVEIKHQAKGLSLKIMDTDEREKGS